LTESANNAKILFVEDEEKIFKSLNRFFSRQGYSVYGAHTAEEALKIVKTNRPDIAILDVMLESSPNGRGLADGYDICKKLRSTGFNKPIIFLTARSTEKDKLQGFQVGADDYVTKPFSLPELQARIFANLRRNRPSKDAYSFGDVEIDLESLEIRHHSTEEEVRLEPLSKRERDLLAYFIQHRDQILTRDRLLQEVWEYSTGIATRTVDTHVLTLRKKLHDNAQTPKFIQTLHGVGYRFIGRES
jgi:DNA-binding response OmpR family regulator